LVELTKRSTENSQTSAVDFVEDFKMNLYSKEIYVLHQKEILILPKGAPLDLPLAYIQK
jgi:GTP pyrophosphokinase